MSAAAKRRISPALARLAQGTRYSFMTFRHQIRVGGRLGRGRSPIDATPAPSLGEVLQAARERKGVDLHRAERDTKIRAKHLAALESGDYTELPGTVYARGFLRNYATYLGLDAEEVLEDWRAEQEQTLSRRACASRSPCRRSRWWSRRATCASRASVHRRVAGPHRGGGFLATWVPAGALLAPADAHAGPGTGPDAGGRCHQLTTSPARWTLPAAVVIVTGPSGFPRPPTRTGRDAAGPCRCR